MWKSEFRHGNHLNDVALEDIFGLIEVRIHEVFDHVLLRGIIDEDVYGAKSIPNQLVLLAMEVQRTSLYVHQRTSCMSRGRKDLREIKDTVSSRSRSFSWCLQHPTVLQASTLW